MAAVISRNKNLILAALLAFVVLSLFQLRAQAYEFTGTMYKTSPTVGGYPVLIVGRYEDSALNVGDILGSGDMPSVVTGGTTAVIANPQPTAILHGTLSSLGVASDTYIGFQWSQDGGVMWTDTATVVANAPGSAQVTITGYDLTIPVQYRIFAQVGAVRSYGGTESFIMTGGSGGVYRFLWTGLLLAIAAVILVFVVVTGMNTKSHRPEAVGVGILIGIIIFAIVRLLMLAIWS